MGERPGAARTHVVVGIAGQDGVVEAERGHVAVHLGTATGGEETRERPCGGKGSARELEPERPARREARRAG